MLYIWMIRLRSLSFEPLFMIWICEQRFLKTLSNSNACKRDPALEILNPLHPFQKHQKGSNSFLSQHDERLRKDKGHVSNSHTQTLRQADNNEHTNQDHSEESSAFRRTRGTNITSYTQEINQTTQKHDTKHNTQRANTTNKQQTQRTKTKHAP